ncbi:MAG TPA: tRNA (adenosine(37)-N6)-threonylcarbamoyltransferase complex ATPase subunit type 1 TsaE, partial [Gammaproteobacteria bacterium]|nr:tRNA (adenosine(37)-N6)-threonylcarbamoyltransferase complex ATPase subunit type 1 TsaE [Gammaproteobacteria bacterium]
ADPDELEYMGIRDYFDGSAICFVEWPERGSGLLPEPDLVINILHREGARAVQLSAAEQTLIHQIKT